MRWANKNSTRLTQTQSPHAAHATATLRSVHRSFRKSRHRKFRERKFRERKFLFAAHSLALIRTIGRAKRAHFQSRAFGGSPLLAFRCAPAWSPPLISSGPPFFANAPSSSSQACDDSLYKCGRNTTLHTLNVSSGVWRLSEQSLDFYKCKEAALGGTPCPGGAGAGTLGEDYCREGHTGPLCSSCANESYYFNEGTSTRLPSR